jgi:hypothetical protein
MGKIDRRQYPELNNLLWDIHCYLVDPKVAFDMYEHRWRYVDTKQITPKEKALVQRLTNEFGNGVFLAA